MTGRETLMCEMYDRYIDQSPFARPLLGTWSATQACVLTGRLFRRWSALNPLNHTSQGRMNIFTKDVDQPHNSRALEFRKKVLGFCKPRKVLR